MFDIRALIKSLKLDQIGSGWIRMDQIGQIRSDEIRLDQIGWDQMTLGMTLGMTSHKINPKSLTKIPEP